MKTAACQVNNAGSMCYELTNSQKTNDCILGILSTAEEQLELMTS